MPMLCDSGLKTEPFLDLAAHLNSLPPSDVPIEVYDGLSSTAKTLLDAHRIIDRMLKQQTAR